MTVIVGMTDHLVRYWDELEDAERRREVRTLISRAEGASALVEALASWASTGGDDDEWSPDLVDVVAWVSDFVADGATLLPGRELRFVDASAAPAYVDRDILMTILDELLKNAAKYSPAGSPITVSVQTSPTGVWVTVDDEGPGFDDGIDPFEPFVRGRDAARRADGSGLGLHIARRLALGAGGDLTVTRLDHGTRMSLALPHHGTVPHQ